MTTPTGLQQAFAPVMLQLGATPSKNKKSSLFSKIFKEKPDKKTSEQKPWSYLALGKREKKELTKILEDQPEDVHTAPYIKGLQKQLLLGTKKSKEPSSSNGTLRAQRAAKIQTMKKDLPILDDKQLWDFLTQLKDLEKVTPEKVTLLNGECDGFILRLMTVIQMTKEDTEERRNFSLTLVRMCVRMIEINKAVKNQQRIDSYATIIEDTAIEEALPLSDFLPKESQI